MSSIQGFAEGFLEFNHASPTPFHVCKYTADQLEANGFTRLVENKAWENVVVRGGKYYFTRNGSTICAFVVGEQYEVGNGFKLVGAHSDSPVLKVKPVSKREGYGVDQVGVETYGGGLWHTWFDRDLGVAGRVIIKLGNSEFSQRLVHIDRPILRIPSLAVHLRTSAERSGFAPNTETHLTPLLSTITNELNTPADIDKRHCSKLILMLAAELEVDPINIVDFELSLCPTQLPVLGGANKEFIFAPRLDNQLHSYVSPQALIAIANENNTTEEGILMAFLFDHEEVGSRSNEGAASPLVSDTIQRLSTMFYSQDKKLGKVFTTTHDELFKIGVKKSILVSSDCSHAVHPNYSHKHEQNHQVEMGKGPGIATSSNQDFSTNAITGFFMRELARQTRVGYFERQGSSGFSPIPVQEFVGRNDQASGSTIGPHLAARVGLRTVDIGVPQLSMHSIREQCAAKDLWSAFYLFRAFFKDATRLDESLSKFDSP